MRLVLRMADPRTRPCDGCREPVSVELAVSVWIKTALGIMCAHTHSGCEDAAVAGQREQPAKRIEEPKTRERDLPMGATA